MPRVDRTRPALQKHPGWQDPTGQAVPRVAQVIWQVGPHVKYSSNGGQTRFRLASSRSFSSSSSRSRSRITSSSSVSTRALLVLEDRIGSANVASSSSAQAATTHRTTPIKIQRLLSIAPQNKLRTFGERAPPFIQCSPTSSPHHLHLMGSTVPKTPQRVAFRMRLENQFLRK